MTHLSPEVVSGYLDAGLSAEERRRAELHLASCSECRKELAEVRQLQRRHSRRWTVALVPVAAAAAVLLAVVLPRRASTPSELRAGSNTEAPLGVVSPLPSPEVAPGAITFIWRSAGPGASYSFTLQAADGRVVWTSTTTDTVVVLPDSVSLSTGPTWFWAADALLADGRSRSTGIKRLSIRP
jgi:anti-sigma factor RsiW